MQGIRVEKRLIIRAGKIYLEKIGLNSYARNTSQKIEKFKCVNSVIIPMQGMRKKF